MSRILFAWELGANLGHLARDIPVAERLRAQGHDVLFAVKDVAMAERLLSLRGFSFVQAPVAPPPQKREAPANYSEMLMAAGYGESPSLYGRVRAWAALFKLHGSHVVVINHAPTALLAVRALGLPSVLTCIGFEVPPQVDPLPSIRPWEEIPQERLQSADAFVLERINGVLSQYGRPMFEHVATLFEGVPTLFTTFAELDHYGARVDGKYVGMFSSQGDGGHRAWPEAGGTRVFAYLRPTVPGFENMLGAMRDADVSAICVAPGIAADVAERYRSPSLDIVTQPVALGPILDGASLAIVYGTGTMSDALLAGVPLLMVPQVVEQALMAERIEAFGAGVLWHAPRTAASACDILDATLANAELRHAAQTFADKYRDFSPDRAAEHVSESILQAARA
ncbi:UDP-glucuronosyltransferase [Ralstonia sp. A12]|uniref:glycosyltransferase n=1 Tax=Ralstonia sp. A12 TaxID=1217052 RepID=UPI000574ABC8|nr:nucleotide disphospho-sugar-binding domain-containing protein [Ralstonia sp. A12]KHK58677.1 UDP-glucuronosyltransferase [Ralstonia sp. A12]